MTTSLIGNRNYFYVSQIFVRIVQQCQIYEITLEPNRFGLNLMCSISRMDLCVNVKPIVAKSSILSTISLKSQCVTPQLLRKYIVCVDWKSQGCTCFNISSKIGLFKRILSFIKWDILLQKQMNRGSLQNATVT